MTTTQPAYPKISIVTTNFNMDGYLEETIRSVLDQQYPNLEYIIIDAGSTDKSVDIIRKYESQLAYWVSEKDDGIYHGINKGLQRSTGEIMAYLNSDDMYHPKSLFTIADIFMNNPMVKWLLSLPTIYDEMGRTVDVGNYKRWSKFMYYEYKFKWIQQESVFWHRDLWEKAGAKLDLNFKMAGDMDLWARFFRHEKLHTTHAIAGGFRRRAGHAAAANARLYLEEARSIIDREVAGLNSSDRAVLSRIRRLHKLKDLFPIASSYSNKRLDACYDYPPDVHPAY